MYLYRVETKVGRAGPWNGPGSAARERWRNHNPSDLPGWSCEPFGDYTHDHMTFLHKKSLVKAWFKAYHRKKLHSEGYVLAKYKVVCPVKADVMVGRWQAIALRDNLVHVADYFIN